MQNRQFEVLSQSIDSAEDIQAALHEAATNLDLAIEAQRVAKQSEKEAARLYGDAEAEFIFEVTFGDAEYGKAKNAETRKVVIDHRLVKARQDGGVLSSAWQAKLRAEQAVFDAELGYAQAEARFNALRSAAYLKANTLHAVALI